MNILPILDYLANLLESGDYEACDVYLKTLDKGELSDEFLKRIVELTRCHAVHLSNWEYVYNQIHDELNRRYLDPQELFPWMTPLI